MRPTRRDMLRYSLRTALGCGALGAGTYGYARAVEPDWLEIVRRDLALPRLPDAFAGFTIAQLSDLHFGPYMSVERIAATLQAVLDLDADTIVITGDFITGSERDAEMIEPALSRLHAREGVFATLGNHDFWYADRTVSRALRRSGITVLQNEHAAWRRGGQALVLAGVDDVWCGRHDLQRALVGLSSSAAVVLLAHEPDFADEVAADGRVMLQLSGHSHGGQVCLPIVGGIHYPPWGRKYPVGMRQVGALTLYTNRGIGMVGVPFRFFCRPEVTLFTLRPPG